MDWGAWSREAVAMMASRTNELMVRHVLPNGAPYRWDLDRAELAIGGVSFRLVTVGTVAGNSFMWAWANESIPMDAKQRLEEVRAFGMQNDLSLLTTACVGGGLAQARECLAIAGRVLNANGIWLDRTESGHIVFALFELRST